MPPITVDPKSSRITGAIPVAVNGELIKILPGVEKDVSDDVIECLTNAGYTFLESALGDGGAVEASTSGVEVDASAPSEPPAGTPLTAEERAANGLDPLDHDHDGRKGGVADATPLTDAEKAALDAQVVELEASGNTTAQAATGLTTLADVQEPKATAAAAPKARASRKK